jgi:hypothetical protein
MKSAPAEAMHTYTNPKEQLSLRVMTASTAHATIHDFPGSHSLVEDNALLEKLLHVKNTGR